MYRHPSFDIDDDVLVRAMLEESRVTVIDGALALTVLLGLILTARLDWWWVDSVVGFVLAGYALREAIGLLWTGSSEASNF